MEESIQCLKRLSTESTLPSQDVENVVPRFMEYLDKHHYPQLQFVVACALTSIVSGSSEHVRVVVEHGAVPKIVRLIFSKMDYVQEQAVWAVGYIAGVSPIYRDLVLSHGALISLLAVVHERSEVTMLRSVAWALRNFCYGNPPAPFEQVKPALRALEYLVYYRNENVLTNACWALSYLSDGIHDKIQTVIEGGLCTQLMELLIHSLPGVVLPALLTIGNIVLGGEAQIQLIIDCQRLPCLFILFTQDYGENIRKGMSWMISNLTLINTDQIQAYIEDNIITPLLFLLGHAEAQIKEKVAWAISNVANSGSRGHIRYLVSKGCIKPLCDLLDSTDVVLVIQCIKSLERILGLGESEKECDGSKVNQYVRIIEQCGGLTKIMRLLLRPDNNLDDNGKEIMKLAESIFERYFYEEEE